MRLKLIITLCALLPAWVAAPAAAQAPTAATLREEIRVLLDRTAGQWAGMMTPAGDFSNPFPADLARGHGSFVPPMLAYALHRAGQRNGNPALVAAAERAWPRAVDPIRASAFDMVGASYAYRLLALSDCPPGATRGLHEPLRDPAQRLPLPERAHLLLQPASWSTRSRCSGSPPPACAPPTRRRGLADPVAARAAAAYVINKWAVQRRRPRRARAHRRRADARQPALGPRAGHDRLPRPLDLHARRGDREARPGCVAGGTAAAAASCSTRWPRSSRPTAT